MTRRRPAPRPKKKHRELRSRVLPEVMMSIVLKLAKYSSVNVRVQVIKLD